MGCRPTVPRTSQGSSGSRKPIYRAQPMADSGSLGGHTGPRLTHLYRRWGYTVGPGARANGVAVADGVAKENLGVDLGV